MASDQVPTGVNRDQKEKMILGGTLCKGGGPHGVTQGTVTAAFPGFGRGLPAEGPSGSPMIRKCGGGLLAPIHCICESMETAAKTGTFSKHRP